MSCEALRRPERHAEDDRHAARARSLAWAYTNIQGYTRLQSSSGQQRPTNQRHWKHKTQRTFDTSQLPAVTHTNAVSRLRLPGTRYVFSVAQTDQQHAHKGHTVPVVSIGWTCGKKKRKKGGERRRTGERGGALVVAVVSFGS